jgi:hypothetical protein
VDDDGTIHVPAFVLPESSLLKEAGAAKSQVARETQEKDAAPLETCPRLQRASAGEAPAITRCVLACRVGKSHYVAAIARELVHQQQMKVLFVESFRLVSNLLNAKRDLKLPRMLADLNKFDIVCLDDVGYVQHTAHCSSASIVGWMASAQIS